MSGEVIKIPMSWLYETNDLDEDVISFILDFPELDLQDIAGALGKDYEEILESYKKPIVQKRLRDMRQRAADMLEYAQAEALRALRRVLRSDNDRAVIEASKIILSLDSISSIEDPNTMTTTYEAIVQTDGRLIQRICNGENKS